MKKFKVNPPKFSPTQISKKLGAGEKGKLWRVNKEKCIGCGICAVNCPKGAELGEDGKARVINDQELEKCGGESVCPYEAILRQGHSAEPFGGELRTNLPFGGELRTNLLSRSPQDGLMGAEN